MTERVGPTEKMMMVRHLGTMLKAGITLPEALATLRDQAKSKGLKTALEFVLKEVENGQSFADSLAKRPKVFNRFFVSLVRIGEESGSLEKNLIFLAKQLEKDNSLRKKIQGAMLYPALVLGATFLIGGFIALFILPKLVTFFEAFDAQLPLTTRLLLGVAEFMRDWGLLFFGGLIFLGGGLVFLVRIKKIRPRWHAFLLKMPVLGSFLLSSQLARLNRNLGVLVTSGIPLNRAMEIGAETLFNLRLRLDLEAVNNQLLEGKKMFEVMSQKKFAFFPPLMVRMIEVGEKTGKLDESFLYLGDFYEEEVENASKSFSTILEPVLLVTIGLVVGFVALAIIGPIYELTGSIQR